MWFSAQRSAVGEAFGMAPWQAEFVQTYWKKVSWIGALEFKFRQQGNGQVLRMWLDRPEAEQGE